MRNHTQSIVIELKYEMYHWMYFLHAINSDRQTRLLNVLGHIAMILGDKRKYDSRLISGTQRFLLYQTLNAASLDMNVDTIVDTTS